jgi:zinc transport system substrate-binding protein
MRIILSLVVGSAVLAGCGSSTGNPNREHVVAAFYPLAYAADQIGGAAVDVTNLTPAGAEPHDLELTPGSVRKIEGADLVLLLGHGFQPQVEEAARRANGRVLLLLDTPGLDRHGNDPHVWLDPARYGLLVHAIGGALHRPAATGRLERRLRALDGEYRRGLASCVRHDIVTSHAAFGYLAERYGLTQISIEGLAPEAEPTPAQLERVARIVRAHHVTTIYFETLVSPRLAETLARETGTKTAVLDPLEGLFPKAVKAGADYFSVMRANLVNLRAGLGCR